jgi:drug/metabolite transporter (DMT)-like permease
MRFGPRVGALLSLLIALVGVVIIWRSTSPTTTTFGWVLLVVGVLFAGVNLLVSRRS